MSDYTVEDFARANRATRGEFDVASRADPEGGAPWRFIASNGTAGWLSDEDMTAEGWTPVVESRITEHTLRHVEGRAERKRERLIRHVSDLEGTIRRRGAALEDLREKLADAERRAELAEWTQDKIAGEANDLRQENDRLERILQSPLWLKVLEVAWEAAEQADECNVGDVLISKCGRDDYNMYRADVESHALSASVRVLSRAPKPSEPWHDLADVLLSESVIFDSEDANIAARALHNAGVRMTGGEES